jgi:hypothetical protein
MFKRLGSKEVEKFATELALKFSRRLPAGTLLKGAQASSLARALDEVYNLAGEFQRERRLGVYGKAKLGTVFKLQLKESGYPEDFVSEVTQALLIRLSAGTSKQS